MYIYVYIKLPNTLRLGGVFFPPHLVEGDCPRHRRGHHPIQTRVRCPSSRGLEGNTTPTEEGHSYDSSQTLGLSKGITVNRPFLFPVNLPYLYPDLYLNLKLEKSDYPRLLQHTPETPRTTPKVGTLKSRLHRRRRDTDTLVTHNPILFGPPEGLRSSISFQAQSLPPPFP